MRWDRHVRIIAARNMRALDAHVFAVSDASCQRVRSCHIASQLGEVYRDYETDPNPWY